MTREEAIEKLNALAWVQGGADREEMIEAVSMAIETLSADRPSGEWLLEEEYGDLWVCDQCGFANEHNDNYCPNCGANMGGSK